MVEELLQLDSRLVFMYSSLADEVPVISRGIAGPCIKQNSPLHGTSSLLGPAPNSSSRQTSFLLASQNPIWNRLLAHTPCTSTSQHGKWGVRKGGMEGQKVTAWSVSGACNLRAGLVLIPSR